MQRTVARIISSIHVQSAYLVMNQYIIISIIIMVQLYTKNWIASMRTAFDTKSL